MEPQASAGWTEQIFGAHYAPLLRFLLKHLQQRQDAEDLAQEAFLRLLRVPHAELIRQPDAYLFRIAANLLTEFRLHTRRLAVVFDSEMAEHAQQTDGAGNHPMDALADSDHLQWAIGQLSPKCRAALLLHRRDGLTYAQIAAQLGVSAEMVKKYIATGVARCRLAFGGEHG